MYGSICTLGYDIFRMYNYCQKETVFQVNESHLAYFDKVSREEMSGVVKVQNISYAVKFKLK